MKIRSIRVAEAVIVLSAVSAWSRSVRIEKPQVSPDDSASVRLVDAIFTEAVFIANRLYGAEITVALAGKGKGGERPLYSVAVFVVKSEGTTVITLTPRA